MFWVCVPPGGCELWESDGTETGTQQLAETVDGACGGSPSDVVQAGPLLFASALDETGGRELWAIPALSDRSEFLVSGTAQGGTLSLGLFGSVVQVTTQAGESATQVVARLVDAVRAHPGLVALGVVALADDDVVFLGSVAHGEASLFTSDAGLAVAPASGGPAVPSAHMAGLAGCAGLLVAIGALALRRSRCTRHRGAA